MFGIRMIYAHMYACMVGVCRYRIGRKAIFVHRGAVHDKKNNTISGPCNGKLLLLVYEMLEKANGALNLI